jgi:predicted  nucleic acid-binding Zn-ribbon protein
MVNNEKKIIGIIVVIAAIFAVIKFNQNQTAQVESAILSQNIAQMMQAVNAGNLKSANANYENARQAMQKIKSNHLKNQSWIDQMSKKMDENQAALNKMQQDPNNFPMLENANSTKNVRKK